MIRHQQPLPVATTCIHPLVLWRVESAKYSCNLKLDHHAIPRDRCKNLKFNFRECRIVPRWTKGEHSIKQQHRHNITESQPIQFYSHPHDQLTSHYTHLMFIKTCKCGMARISIIQFTQALQRCTPLSIEGGVLPDLTDRCPQNPYTPLPVLQNHVPITQA